MKAESIYNWLLEQAETGDEITTGVLEESLGQDAEHALFLLEYGVKYGFVESRTSGDTQTFRITDTDALRKAAQIDETPTESETGETDIAPGLVIGVPVGLKEAIESLRPSYDTFEIYYLDEAFTKILRSAREEVFIASPFLDEAGLDLIWEDIKALPRRGISLYLLTRDLHEQPSQQQYAQAKKRQGIARIKEVYEAEKTAPSTEFSVRDFGKRTPGTGSVDLQYEGLHQKMVIADTKAAYIGSGEVRRNALQVNGEAGVVTTDSQQVGFWRDYFDVFWDDSRTVGDQFFV